MKFLRLISVFFTLVYAVSASAATSEEVVAFADGLARQALDIVQSKELNAPAKQHRLEELFGSHVDIDWVAQFVLGKYWRTASFEQQEAYKRNYRAFVLKYYSAKLTDYTGQEYKIKGAREDNDPGEYLLGMELVNKDEPNVLVDYRIRDSEGKLQIFDIVIEGVSMITTQRSEFNSVVSNKGLDYLIEALEKKAAASVQG